MTMEQLDKIWCSALAENCDLKTVTAITKKVQKQEAESDSERFGQWCRALIKSTDDRQAGKLIAANAVQVWQAQSGNTKPAEGE